MTGVKHDNGKLFAGLLLEDFPRAMSAVARVATFGAHKYARSNWLAVEDAQQRYGDALMRHLLADQLEAVDGESDLPHLYHAAWNLLAVIELRERAAEVDRRAWPLMEADDAHGLPLADVRGHTPSELEEFFRDDRVDAIARNGNNGEHYKAEAEQGLINALAKHGLGSEQVSAALLRLNAALLNAD